MASKNIKMFLFKKTGIPCENWKRVSKVASSQGGSLRQFEDRRSGRLIEMREDEHGAPSVISDSCGDDLDKSHGALLVALAYKLDALKKSNPSSKAIAKVLEAVGLGGRSSDFAALLDISPFDMDRALALPIFSSGQAVSSILDVAHYRVVDEDDEHIVEFSDGLGLRDGDGGLFFSLIKGRVRQLFEERGLKIRSATGNSVSVSGETGRLSSALHASGATWADGSNHLAEMGLCFGLEDSLDYDEIHGAPATGASGDGA